MTLMKFTERTPFDILAKNFFNASEYAPLTDLKLPHPVDIYQTDDHLVFEIACTGLDKNDLEIQVRDNTLRVLYDKQGSDDKEYLYKGITKRSFNLGWKIDSKFDLDKAEATFKSGLLTVEVPFKEESKSKVLKIK